MCHGHHDVGPRLLAWLICLPLAAAGSLIAHTAAYLVAEPDADRRATELARTGHSYLENLPAIGVFALVGLVGAIVLSGRDAARGRAASWSPSPRFFALLPPLGFTLQEHVERALASGSLRLDVVGEPAFVLGLALQLPFGLAAFLAARALLAVARAAGRRVAARRPRAAFLAPLATLPPRPAPPPLRQPQPLAARSGGRGPPLAFTPR
jgi:hypothetical protein